MRAILEFNLPEDREEYERANAATKLYSYIFDFDNYLRGQAKSDNPVDLEKIIETWYEMRDFDIDDIYS